MRKYGAQYHCYIHDCGVEGFISMHTWPAGLVPDLMWPWEVMAVAHINLFHCIWIPFIHVNIYVTKLEHPRSKKFSTHRQSHAALIAEAPGGCIKELKDLIWISSIVIIMHPMLSRYANQHGPRRLPLWEQNPL
jgi:hypothetical protein